MIARYTYDDLWLMVPLPSFLKHIDRQEFYQVTIVYQEKGMIDKDRFGPGVKRLIAKGHLTLIYPETIPKTNFLRDTMTVSVSFRSLWMIWNCNKLLKKMNAEYEALKGPRVSA